MAAPVPIHARSLGLLAPGRVRRILTLAGWQVRATGRPGPGDAVAVWGHGRTARRGEALAARSGARLIRLEDGFLRSVLPARRGPLGLPVRGDRGPAGLIIDDEGIHYDPSGPSRLETLLATHPLDDTGLLARARTAMARIAASDLSKYNPHDPALAAPPPGYVLVVDQVRGDASVTHGGVTAAAFRVMLGAARLDHPRARIVVKAHPAGPGHLDGAALEMAGGAVARLEGPLSPHRLLEGAVAVYTVSSQLGFEAILAGHRPVVFGAPFYAGWGLSEDRGPVPARRTRRLTRAQVFAAAMILAPVWHDPCRDRLCDLEEALDQIEAEVRAFRDDRAGHVASGMRLWKRATLARFFAGVPAPARPRPAVIFRDAPAAAAALARRTGRPLLVWAGREAAGHAAAPALVRVEDGFLRSRGLGAALVPPLSLVTDASGIYYDPTRPSDLEALVLAGPPPGGEARAAALIARLRADGVTKYNLPGAAPALPERRPRILVPGQVEDDASIRLGATGPVRTNRALLEAVRAANPDAAILYKPHPDVEAGLRPGAVPDAATLADAVLRGTGAAEALGVADAVATITSTLGFEALLRGLPVTCHGAPFYAGWGLTQDLGPVPARRGGARPTLAALAHAVLIAYPRYRDPVSGLPCPPEVAAARLAAGRTARPGPALRALAKAQGALAGRAWLWRR